MGGLACLGGRALDPAYRAQSCVYRRPGVFTEKDKLDLTKPPLVVFESLSGERLGASNASGVGGSAIWPTEEGDCALGQPTLRARREPRGRLSLRCLDGLGGGETSYAPIIAQ